MGSGVNRMLTSGHEDVYVRLGLKDGVIVAANVISGSGARYQGGVHVWWSKGDEADLYDLMADPEMKKPVHCVEKKKS